MSINDNPSNSYTDGETNNSHKASYEYSEDLLEFLSLLIEEDLLRKRNKTPPE